MNVIEQAEARAQEDARVEDYETIDYTAWGARAYVLFAEALQRTCYLTGYIPEQPWVLEAWYVAAYVKKRSAETCRLKKIEYESRQSAA